MVHSLQSVAVRTPVLVDEWDKHTHTHIGSEGMMDKTCSTCNNVCGLVA